MSVTKPILTTPGTGEAVEFGNGSRAEIAVDGSQSGGEYAVVRYTVASGDEPPLHTHSKEDELVFVLEGELTAFVGDASIDVGPGAFAALPRGIPHTIRVKGNSAKVLLTLIPAGIERFFVPRSDEDSDPARYGLELHDSPPASVSSVAAHSG